MTDIAHAFYDNTTLSQLLIWVWLKSVLILIGAVVDTLILCMRVSQGNTFGQTAIDAFTTQYLS